MGRPRKYPEPKVGDRFNYFTVVEVGPSTKPRRIKVQCDCGAKGPYWTGYSNIVNSKHVGCRVCFRAAVGLKVPRQEAIEIIQLFPNNKVRQSLINRRQHMVQRTTDHNHKNYKHYGGRGISVCKEWVGSTAAFLQDITQAPGYQDFLENPRLQIDRIDNNGNYEPGNVRFVTSKQNQKNRRTVTELQARIAELEAELEERKSTCSCLSSTLPGLSGLSLPI